MPAAPNLEALLGKDMADLCGNKIHNAGDTQCAHFDSQSGEPDQCPVIGFYQLAAHTPIQVRMANAAAVKKALAAGDKVAALLAIGGECGSPQPFIRRRPSAAALSSCQHASGSTVAPIRRWSHA